MGTARGFAPPVAVLFKASSGAKLAQQLEKPPWLMLQFQERGSYRAPDVVDALRWALRPASCPQESVVVLLDWFAAHLTDEVEQAIRDMGHVVLYHGGGVTGIEQVNDTHLHASVQRSMEQLETAFMLELRASAPEKMASLRRQDVLDLVSQMWRGLDHRNLSTKGYRQTGPCLPEGASADEVFVDLRPVWEAIGGQAVREEANRTVDELWAAGVLASWADVDQVIEHHAPHEGIAEGLEGVEWEVGAPGDDDDADDAGDDDADDADEGGEGADEEQDSFWNGFGGDDDDGGAGGPASATGAASSSDPAGGSASAAGASSSSHPSGGAASAGASSSSHPGGGAASAAGASAAGAISAGGGGTEGDAAGVAAGGLSTDPAYLAALRQVAEVAGKTRNDALLRPVLRELRRSSVKRATADTPQATELRAKALAEQEKIKIARTERLALERKAKLADIEAQTALEQARAEAATARRKAIVASAAAREAELRRTEETARARRESVWLQTEFPAALANRLLRWRRGLPESAADELRVAVKKLCETQRCERGSVGHLWQHDKSLTKPCCFVCLPGHGAKRTPVRCSRDFEWVLFGQAWAAESYSADAASALEKLLDRVCPRGSLPFRRHFALPRVLETCDCVADQAFVYAVVLLSKWLGVDRFPEGVHAWPPAPPAAATAGP